jgi:Lipopolysaccharide export system permease LptF/LptG
MTHGPGASIRAIAARTCGAEAVERVIDPTLADFHLERDQATRLGQPWRRRWLRVRLSLALVQAIVLCAIEHLWLKRAIARADEGAVDATLATTLLATAAALTLFVLPPLSSLDRFDWRMVVLLVPQAVPIALPIGVTFGVLAGRRRVRMSARLVRMCMAIALGCSTASLIALAWIVPDANQLFRERIFHQRHPPGVEEVQPYPLLTRGTNELTMAELKRQIRASSPDRRVAPLTVFTYYQRWALSAATIVMVLFALVATARWQIGRLSGSIVALSSCIAYWLLLMAGRQYALAGVWPPIAAAWLPNLVVAGTAMAIALTTPRAADAR